MKILILFAIFAYISPTNIKLDQEWDEFKVLYKKYYETKSEETKR